MKNPISKNNSRTDLSVASSADTGIVGDIDNKVFFFIFKKTPKFLKFEFVTF